MHLSPDELTALHNDPAYAEAIPTYRGEGPLYVHVLNDILADERKQDAANCPVKRPDGEDLRGRYRRQKLVR